MRVFRSSAFRLLSRHISGGLQRIDVTRRVAQTLCDTFPNPLQLLRDPIKIAENLNAPLLCKIPFVTAYPESCLRIPTIFEESTTGQEARRIVERVAALETQLLDMDEDMSEECVFKCTTQITGAMWLQLCGLLSNEPIMSLKYNKKDHSGSAGGRPDEIVHYMDLQGVRHLVFEGEHKCKYMQQAIADLEKKAVTFNEKEFGDVIRFLPSYGAAGHHLMFCLLDLRLGKVIRVATFDMRVANDRAEAVKMSINMLRLVLTMLPFCVSTANPIFLQKDSVSFFPGYVLKKLGKYRAPTELYDLLATGDVPHAVTVKVLKKDELKITPVGIRILGNGEDLNLSQLKDAMRCVLTCCNYLHEKGFVHRDLRWPNIVWDYTFDTSGHEIAASFRVIDFEFASFADNKMDIAGYIFEDLVKPMEQYHKAHDVFLVGKLVQDWHYAHEVTVSALARDFICAAQRLDSTATAEEVLKHSWLLSQ